MNNEPVAWLVDNQAYTIKEAAESLSRILETPVIPLYADTSKEMIEMIDALKKENELLRKRFGEELDAHHSALRKISKLRKAQEK